MTKYTNRVSIEPLKRASIPSMFIFYDCETKSTKDDEGREVHRLWFGHALFWKPSKRGKEEVIEKIDFTENRDFWSWVVEYIKKGDTLYLFAHNVKFDFLVSQGFQVLPSLGFTMQGIYHKFTTTIMRWKDGKRSLVIADTMNYFQSSLEKIAGLVGETKIQVDFDNPNVADLWKRCRSDVRITYKAVRLLLDKLQADDLGGFKITAPSLSFSIFRSRFLKHRLITHHNDDGVKLEKDAYYGGYVNVFQIVGRGQPELYKLDINAMYPSVMLDNAFPVEMVDHVRDVSRAILDLILKSYLVTVRATVQTNEAVYPMRYDGGVCYPVGTFETTLSTPSLLYARKHGHLQKVHELISYKKAVLFHDYVEYMYKNRMKAKETKDRAGEMFYKLMMNSLYGKFGQSSLESKVIGSCDPDEFVSYTAVDADTGETWREIHAGGSVISLKQGDESRYTFYAVAAHVTDYARRVLFDIIKLAGREHVYYSDTDSVLVDDEGLNRVKGLMDELKLGYLKVEDKGDLFIGFAKKDYLLGSERKLKGFSRKPDADNPHKFTTHQSVSFYGVLRARLVEGAYWKTVMKYHNPYVKDCKVDVNGVVHPLYMPDDYGMLGSKVFTLDQIKRLILERMTKRQREKLNAWV